MPHDADEVMARSYTLYALHSHEQLPQRLFSLCSGNLEGLSGYSPVPYNVWIFIVSELHIQEAKYLCQKILSTLSTT